MKIKLFKIEKNYRKENFEINPDIYWKMIMVLAFLVIITSLVFSYNLFVQTNKDNISIVEKKDNKNENKEKEKIRNALEYFSEREKKSIEILNFPVPIVDPSI